LPSAGNTKRTRGAGNTKRIRGGQQECHYHWKAIALDFVEPTKKCHKKGTDDVKTKNKVCETATAQATPFFHATVPSPSSKKFFQSQILILITMITGCIIATATSPYTPLIFLNIKILYANFSPPPPPPFFPRGPKWL
jgi:hypothetical protein